MSKQETGLGYKVRQIRIVDMNMYRNDVASHRNVSRDVSRRISRFPGVKIKTPGEVLAAEIKRQREAREKASTPAPEVSLRPEELETRTPEWKKALGHAVMVIGALAQKAPDEVDSHIVTLFEGLRDPDRHEQTIKKVEVLYEAHVASART